MQTAAEESSYKIKYNIKERIASWAQLKHYPVVNVERNYNNSNLNISANFDMDTWIFVSITTQTHLNLKRLLPEVWIAPDSTHHILNIYFLNNRDWILANLQQKSKY